MNLVAPLSSATADPPFAAFVGIDWADQEHAVCLIEHGATVPEHRKLPQTAEAIDEWASSLRLRCDGRPVAVCLEQSKGALIYALMKYDHLVLFPINPKQLARYREAVAPSGAKDDPDDAHLLADFLVGHRQRLRPWKPDDAKTRLIAMLAEDRRTAVDLRTQLTNMLRSRLKQYFPLALEMTGDELHSPMACDFLATWPTLQALQQADPATLRRFFTTHNSRSARLIDQRLERVATAKPLTTDPAVIESGSRQVRLLVQQLRELIEPIRDYDERLAQLVAEHPDGHLFTPLPGAGEALAPRLLAAFGSDRDRFASAAELAQYSGIAPVTKQSGKTKIVHCRWACPTFLKQTFHEFANQSRTRSVWAGAYYEMLRERGCGHHAAVRALAFKWIRILFRCWKTRTAYDESIYLASLRARAAPLLKHLAA
jgi:transposase